MKFNNRIQDIAKAGLLISLALVTSLLTSNYLPKIPFINGHIDFWYVFVLMIPFALKTLDIKIISIITAPFAMLITEINSYAGMYDYFLETGFPLFAITTIITASYIENKWIKLFASIFIIIAWNSFRFFGQTYAGIAIYNVPTFTSSAAINAPNTFFDLVGIIPVFLILYSFLFIKTKNHK